MSTTTKVSTVTFTGVTGNSYNFSVWPKGTSFKAIGAVYFFTKRYQKNDGAFVHKAIYIGETKDLSTRFDSHHRMQAIERQDANVVCILVEESLTKRKAIEADLRDKYSPPCNLE